MRGTDSVQDQMWSYVSAEDWIPPDHPLRPLRLMVNRVLESLSPEFSRLYSGTGCWRGGIAEAFFDRVLAEAKSHGLLSDEHFTADGTPHVAQHSRYRRSAIDGPRDTRAMI